MKLIDASANEISFNVYPDFEHTREMDIEWCIVSNGNQLPVDRGFGADRYTTLINVKGLETTIDALIAFISNARKSALLSGNNNYSFIIESENDGEYIFGPDIDLSGGSTVNIIDYGVRTQVNWKLWSISITMQISSPVFVGTPGLPSSFCAKTQIETDSTWDIIGIEFYNSDFHFVDQNSDTGSLKFSFDLTDSDMRNLCRYIYSTNRGATIANTSWPVFYKSPAIANPFDIYGPRRTHTATGFRIRAFENLKYLRPGWWSAEITFIESF